MIGHSHLTGQYLDGNGRPRKLEEAMRWSPELVNCGLRLLALRDALTATTRTEPTPDLRMHLLAGHGSAAAGDEEADLERAHAYEHAEAATGHRFDDLTWRTEDAAAALDAMLFGRAR